MADLLGIAAGLLLAAILACVARLIALTFPEMAVDLERDEDDPYPGGM